MGYIFSFQFIFFFSAKKETWLNVCNDEYVIELPTWISIRFFSVNTCLAVENVRGNISVHQSMATLFHFKILNWSIFFMNSCISFNNIFLLLLRILISFYFFYFFFLLCWTGWVCIWDEVILFTSFYHSFISKKRLICLPHFIITQLNDESSFLIKHSQCTYP